MLYNEEATSDERRKPSDTNVFGTNMLLAQGVQFIGKSMAAFKAFTSVDELIEFITRYMRLEPGDLIFTGTPSGVELEHKEGEKNYLKPGDRVDVVIEDLGTLTKYMV